MKISIFRKNFSKIQFSSSVIFYNYLFDLISIFITKDSSIFKWSTDDSDRIINEEPHNMYPNGWVPILESSELLSNQIKPIHIVGKDLVVFRGSTGKARVFDAYCPHLGANLGVGGTITGDSVQCPFHGWVFDQNGKCSHIPEIESPLDVHLNKYNSIEVNGFICIWHHTNSQPPTWKPEKMSIPEENHIQYRGKSIYALNCYITDLFENAVDLQHLNFLHGFPIQIENFLEKPWYFEKIYKYFYFDWSPQIKFGEGESSHLFDGIYQGEIKLFGIILAKMYVGMHVMGPYMSNLKFVFNVFGKRQFRATQCIIPHKDMNCMLVSRYYSESGLLNLLIARFVISESSSMVGRDAMIWANKKFLPQPILTKQENSILKYRRWLKQFNSKLIPG